MPRGLPLAYDGRRWSYRALDRAADRLARYFHRSGAEPEHSATASRRLRPQLGCISDRMARLHTRHGLIHVPASYAQTSGELAYIVAQVGPRGRSLYDPELEPNLVAARAAEEGRHLFRPFIDEGRPDVLAAAMDSGTGGRRIRPGAIGQRGIRCSFSTPPGRPALLKGTRDDDSRMPAGRLSELHRRSRASRRRPCARRAAALPPGADALLQHAPAARRRDDHSHPCARARVVPGPYQSPNGSPRFSRRRPPGSASCATRTSIVGI